MEFRELAIPAAKAFFAKTLGEEGTTWIEKYLAAIDDVKKGMMK